MAASRTAVLILGMHRSGTSTLTGLLSLLGCDLPATVMPANDFNAKGYFESLEVCKLNDAILASDNSIWHDWQSFDQTWFQSDKASEFFDCALDVLEKEYGSAPLFLLKDPRICRLLPFWLKVLEHAGIDLVVVQTHRNPLEVAESLQVRDGLHAELGKLLWLQHVLSAERYTRGIKRCFISYDRLLSNWQSEVARVSQALGLSWPRPAELLHAEVDDFLSPSLRHYQKPKELVLEGSSVSRWLSETYAVLELWAEQGEDEGRAATLDRIFGEFNQAAPNFAQVVALAQSSFRKAVEQEAELSILKAEVQEFRQAQMPPAQPVNVVVDRCDELLNELALLNHRLQDGGQQLSTLQQSCHELRGVSEICERANSESTS